jgi:hypothetical protein
MKRFGLLVLLILAISVPAFAQGPYPDGATGDISAYADAEGTSCALTSTGGLMQVFIVHKFSDGGGATGCRFKVTLPAGMTSFGFNTTFVPIGDVLSDLSLAYGICIESTTSLGSVNAFSAAAPPVCSYVSVVAADNFSDPITTDCVFGEYKVETGQGIVNDDGSCACNIATQPSTWGKVKSLYR